MLLVETSLDINLHGGAVSYEFSAPVLPGLSVVEAADHIWIVVPLADGAVFRLVFPHPNSPVRRAGRGAC